MTYLKIIRESAENERSEKVHIYREQEKELTISYTNAYRTCGICGATMRTRQEIPAFFYREGSYEGILKSGIEVKVSSEGCLAKCAAVARGKDAYF